MAITVEDLRTIMQSAADETHAAHQLLHTLKTELDSVTSLDGLQAVKDSLATELAGLQDEMTADTAAPVVPPGDVTPPAPAPADGGTQG